MEKAYRLLPWLDMAQAVDYLEYLTKTPITDPLFIQLCEAGECAVYLDCMGLDGESPVDAGEGLPAYEPVLGRGHCKVTTLYFSRYRLAQTVIGPALFLFDDIIRSDREWIIRSNRELLSPIFKAAEIEALAAKMNEAPEHPSTAEIEDLRQQLEEEKAKRKAEREFWRQQDQHRRAVEEHLTEQLNRAESVIEYARECAAQAEAETKAAEADPKPSHLLAIAVLLELLKAPVEFPRPRGMNQAAIKSAILEKFPWPGLSERNLEMIFAAANKAKAGAE